MRIIAVVAAAVTAFVVALSVPPQRAGAAGCNRPTAARWAAAQSAFSGDFLRIRTYLLQPTLTNQSSMYARVNTGLFEYYSFEGGELNRNKGRASGNFTLQFRTGSQCIQSGTKTISFQVVVQARFTSTNHQRLSFSRLARVAMTVPRITSYTDPITH